MVNFSINVRGLDELSDTFTNLPAEAEPILTRALTNVAAVMVETIQELISTSFPPPSVPGEPPHLRTGALRRSVRIERVEPLRVTMAIGGAGTLVPYAGFLEFGTTKMPPRPFVEPTTREASQFAPQAIAEEINRSLEGLIR